MKYSKNSMVVDAIQFIYNPETIVALREFLGAAMGDVSKARHMGAKAELELLNKDGKIKGIALDGDYLLKTETEFCYICNAFDFEKDYVLVIDFYDLSKLITT